MTLADWFAKHLHHRIRVGERLPLGSIQLVVDGVAHGRVTTVGLDLADDEPNEPRSRIAEIGATMRGAVRRLGQG